jgi:RHS repeat-associated protein
VPYAEFDDEIGWNEFALRNYDPQIGRWTTPDPYEEFASPYVGMGDDPINLTDPSGGSILDGLSGVARVAVTTLGGAIIGGFIDVLSGGDGGKGLLIGAGVGLAAGLGSLVQQITLSMGIQTVNLAVKIINTSVKTEQAGSQARLDGPKLIIRITIRQSTNSRIINKLNQVVKLKTFRTAWEKSNDEEWEWGFDVTEDEDNYYGENLHPGEERTKITPRNQPIVGKFLLGNVHVHYIGLRNAHSPEDINALRDVLTINPKFGVFVILQTEDAYFAIVVTNVEKAKNFFDTNDLNDIAKLIIKPIKKEKDTTKRRIRKIKKALKGRGLKMFKTIDKNKFKPA